MVLTAKNSTFTQLSLTHKYTITQSIKCQTYTEADQSSNTVVSGVDTLGLPCDNDNINEDLAPAENLAQ